MGDNAMGWAIGLLVAVAFPVVFITFWMGVTSILGLLSGWFTLQAQYPRGTEQPLATRAVRFASMGIGVQFRGGIKLAACPSGLQVSANRLIAPLQRPFLVPWHEVVAEDGKSFWTPIVRLRFGRPEVGKLVVRAIDWAAIEPYTMGRVERRAG